MKSEDADGRVPLSGADKAACKTPPHPVAAKSGLLASQLPCPVDYSGVLSYLSIGVPTQLLSVLIPAHIKNKNKTARMRRGRSIIAGKEDEANVSIVSNANVN